MPKSVKTKNKEKTLPIGTRVCHTSDKSLDEGVIVWVYKNDKGVLPQYDGKIYLVFWSNHKRGVYRHDEIKKNNIKALTFNLQEEETI